MKVINGYINSVFKHTKTLPVMPSGPP